MVAKRMFNFRLEETVVRFLDDLATRAGFTRSEAVRQSAQVANALLLGAREQSIARLAALREQYGDDAQLIAVATEGEDGKPRGHLVIDGEELRDARAVPALDEKRGRVSLFLNMPDLQPEAVVLATLGDERIYIPELSFSLGELPWPPDPTKGLVIRLGDLDRIIENDPMLAESVEA